jgi:hypothetical protein
LNKTVERLGKKDWETVYNETLKDLPFEIRKNAPERVDTDLLRQMFKDCLLGTSEKFLEQLFLDPNSEIKLGPSIMQIIVLLGVFVFGRWFRIF